MSRISQGAAAILAVLCALVAGCGEQTDSRADNTDVAEEIAAAPALPTTYAYTLTSSCGERPLLGTYRVTVRDNQVTDGKNMNDNYPHQSQSQLRDLPTLQDILDMTGDAPPDTIVEFVVDDTGVPRSLSLDPIANGIDDEECYEVTNFEPVA